MTPDDQLIPVPIPPLADLLAQAEKLKGSRLVESEVLRIRDKAICMMLRKKHAQQMAESRGYRDVNPENCWADWHRLRVRMTGQGYEPKIVMCLPGDSDFPSRSLPILDGTGVTHEFAAHDERMVQAFRASANLVHPSLDEGDFARIAVHETVLYILSRNFSAEDGPAVSGEMLRLGSRLLKSGALGLKCESAGITHAPSRWIKLADLAASAHSAFEAMEALFLAYVQMPIGNGDDVYTCGMHLLGQPDLVVAETLLKEATDAGDAHAFKVVDLFQALAMYLLAECPEGEFVSGQTFATDSRSRRFRIVWEECTGYGEDDFYFNPFGRWRFLATCEP